MSVVRRWILWLLVIAFFWILVSRYTEIEKIAETLASGQWNLVLVALIVQAVYFITFAASYK